MPDVNATLMAVPWAQVGSTITGAAMVVWFMAVWLRTVRAESSRRRRLAPSCRPTPARTTT